MKQSIIKFNTGKSSGIFVSVPYNIMVSYCQLTENEEGNEMLIIKYGNNPFSPSSMAIVFPQNGVKHKTILGLTQHVNEHILSEYLKIDYEGYIDLLKKHDIPAQIVPNHNYGNYYMIIVNDN